MKKIYCVALLVACFSTQGNSQDIIAKIKFEDAETAFQEKDFAKTLQKLNEAETLLGASNPKIAYLRILTKGELCKRDASWCNGLKGECDNFITLYQHNPAVEDKIKEVYRLSENVDKLKPDDEFIVDQLRNEAQSLTKEKKYSAAAIKFGEVISKFPNSANVNDYFLKARMYYYAENYDVSAASFREIERLFPDRPSTIFWQARIASALDPEAKQGTAQPLYLNWLDALLRQSITPPKNDALIAYQYIAFYNYNIDKKDEAFKYAKKIVELEPNDKFANQIIQALK